MNMHAVALWKVREERGLKRAFSHGMHADMLREWILGEVLRERCRLYPAWTGSEQRGPGGLKHLLTECVY